MSDLDDLSFQSCTVEVRLLVVKKPLSVEIKRKLSYCPDIALIFPIHFLLLCSQEKYALPVSRPYSRGNFAVKFADRLLLSPLGTDKINTRSLLPPPLGNKCNVFPVL